MHSGSFWSPRNPVDDTAPSSGLSHLVSLRSSGSAGDCVSVPSRAAQHRRLDPGLLRCPSVRSRGLDGGRRIDSAAGSGLFKQGRFCRDEVGRQPLRGETRSALPHRPASSPHPRGTWLHEDLSLKVSDGATLQLSGTSGTSPPPLSVSPPAAPSRVAGLDLSCQTGLVIYNMIPSRLQRPNSLASLVLPRFETCLGQAGFHRRRPRQPCPFAAAPWYIILPLKPRLPSDYTRACSDQGLVFLKDYVTPPLPPPPPLSIFLPYSAS